MEMENDALFLSGEAANIVSATTPLGISILPVLLTVLARLWVLPPSVSLMMKQIGSKRDFVVSAALSGWRIGGAIHHGEADTPAWINSEALKDIVLLCEDLIRAVPYKGKASQRRGRPLRVGRGTV